MQQVKTYPSELIPLTYVVLHPIQKSGTFSSTQLEQLQDLAVTYPSLSKSNFLTASRQIKDFSSAATQHNESLLVAGDGEPLKLQRWRPTSERLAYYDSR